MASLQEQFPGYWPTNPGDKSTFGKLVVKLLSEKQETYCTVRKIELSLDSTYINLATRVCDVTWVVSLMHSAIGHKLVWYNVKKWQICAVILLPLVAHHLACSCFREICQQSSL